MAKNDEKEFTYYNIILINRIRCVHCGDIISSTNSKKINYCMCGVCGVEGGFNFLKRYYYKTNDFDEMSVIVEIEEEVEDEKRKNK
jgi:hypothetical protein